MACSTKTSAKQTGGGACVGNPLSDSGDSCGERTIVRAWFTAVVRPLKALLLLLRVLLQCTDLLSILCAWWKHEKRHKQLTSAGVPRAGTVELHAIRVRLVRRGLPLLRRFGSPSHDPLDRGRQMAESLVSVLEREQNQVFQ